MTIFLEYTMTETQVQKQGLNLRPTKYTGLNLGALH